METTNLDLEMQGGSGCNLFWWVNDIPPTSNLAKSITHESNDCKLFKVRESENMFLRGVLCVIFALIALVYWDYTRKCS